MNQNFAAQLTSPRSDLTVREVPYRSPGAGQLVIRNRAIAVNPLDVVKQSTGNMSYRWLPYPAVLGEDVAGDVVEVGPGVSRFAVGDRVMAYAVGMEKGVDHAAEGGFQLYTVVRQQLTAPLPDSLSFQDAVVLPLAVSTAASALFGRIQLALRHPTGSPTGNGRTVVVWSGASSVGSNAIQLAVAAGYDVISTASPRNHDLLRRLGADQVFDYRSDDAVSSVVAALEGKDVAGVLAIGTGSAEPCVAIAAATGARRVSLTSPSVSLQGAPRRAGALVPLVARLVARTGALQIRSRVRGIRAAFVWGSALMNDQVGPMLWEQFLPGALAEGRYTVSPEAEVVGEGLEHVQSALNRLSTGVAAKKLVITL